jgi:diguanylate cyclase (GGDEF)-like protein
MDAARLDDALPGGADVSLRIKRSIASLTFEQPLETQFRDDFQARNLVRARVSTLIYLVLLGVLTAINLLGGAAPAQEVLGSIFKLRAGLLCPALLVILAATYVPILKKHFQIVVALAATVAGIAVNWITALAAIASLPQFAQMGNVLVLVYGCLFLGLLYKPVVFVASASVLAFFVAALSVGIPPGTVAFGGALMTATALMAVLSALRVERLVRMNFIETRMLNDAAQRDGLTGLFNRRSFESLTKKLWRLARREHQPLQFLLIDIDHFKEYNDWHGHQAGDDCLRTVAHIIESSANRPFDFSARYGGEEFALFVYGQSLENVAVLPEQIREAVLAEQIPHHSASTGMVTVSIGSAYLGPDGNRSLNGLIQAADEALYEAKSMGRNRIVYKDAGQLQTNTGSFRATPPATKAG